MHFSIQRAKGLRYHFLQIVCMKFSSTREIRMIGTRSLIQTIVYLLRKGLKHNHAVDKMNPLCHVPIMLTNYIKFIRLHRKRKKRHCCNSLAVTLLASRLRPNPCIQIELQTPNVKKEDTKRKRKKGEKKRGKEKRHGISMYNTYILYV